MSKAADSSSKISIEDWEPALVKASTTESKAVSVECPPLTHQTGCFPGGCFV